MEDNNIYSNSNIPTPLDFSYLESTKDSLTSSNYGTDIPKPSFPSFPEWMYNQPETLQDNSKFVNGIISNIRRNTLNFVNNYHNKFQNNGVGANYAGDDMAKMINPNFGKINLSGTTKLTDTHELLSDGETWVPKYKYYKPGLDNDALNASMQTNTEKFFNPIKRSFTKFVPNVAGGLVSMVNGLGEAIVTGRGEAIFDNATSRWLDDLNKKVDFDFKNYYTKEQDNFGFNTNTWDKVLGGVDFTVQMMGSEAVMAALSGGTSIPASIAKTIGRFGIKGLEVLDKASDVARVVDVANDVANVKKTGNFLSKAFSYFNKPIREVAENGGVVLSAERTAESFNKILQGKKLKEWANMGRFMYTTSAYEAGFEARHYQQEAENQFWDYYRQNGKEPTTEEINNFYSKLDDSTWNVFGANMAILSASNMAMFGKAFNVKNPFPKLTDGSFVDKTLFRIGTEKTADGTVKALKSNFFNKTLAYASPFVKGALVEGVYEEGSQGIASNMMKNYIASTYDPKAMRETSDYMSSFTKAFKDQFSTKSGVEEIAIGGIIGGLFGGLRGGVQNVSRKYKTQDYTAKVQNSFQGVADQITSNLYTNENIASLLGHSNRLQKINENTEQAKSTGDKIAESLHSSEAFISTLQAAQSVGKEAEFMKVLESTIKGMDNSKIAESQNIDLNSVDSFKQENIQGLQKLADNYTKAREVAEYIFSDDKIGGLGGIVGKEKLSSREQAAIKSNLIDAFAYTSAMGHISQELAGDSFNAFQQKLAEVGTSPEIVEKFGAIAALRATDVTTGTSYEQSSRELKRVESEMDNLKDEIVSLQKEESNTQNVTKLKEKNAKYLELGKEATKHRANKELYWKSISDNFYKKLGKSGFLPQIDLDNFENTTRDLKEYLNSASGMSEYDRVELEKLLDSFHKSTETFKSFNNLTKALSNPNFTFKTYKGLFGNLRSNKQSLNDITKKTLMDLYNINTDTSDIIEQYQTTPKQTEITDDEYKEFTDKGIVSVDRLKDISDKVKNKKELSEKEKAIFDKKKSEIDNIIKSENEIDPILDKSEKTKLNPLKVRINAIKAEIKQLEKGEIVESVKDEYERLQKELKKAEEDLKALEQSTPTTETSNISGIEKQIEFLEAQNETSKKVEKNYRETNKQEYQQYSVIKPNGEEVTGHLEINKGIVQIVNENEIVDVVEESDFDTNNLDKHGIKLIQEDDVLIENNEVYVNGKLYSLPKGTTTLDENILEDENGNYSVKLRAGNGRVVTLSGSVADKIVYEHLLNKFEENATEQQIREAREQAERDAKIEKLYEKLDNETKNRDSQKQKQTELTNKIEELQNEISELIPNKIEELQNEIEDLKSKDSAEKKLENKKQKLKEKIAELKNEISNDIGENKYEKIDSKNPTYNKIRRLRKLEKELENLNQIKQDFNPNTSFEDQLQWFIDNIKILEFQDINSLTSLETPSREKMERYGELLNKKRKTKKEKEEYIELRDELLKYKIVENGVFEGVPLLDLISAYNETKNISDIVDKQKLTIADDELQNSINNAQFEYHNSKWTPFVGLMNDGTYVSGNEIHQIRLNTILNKALTQNRKIKIEEFNEDEKGNIIFSDAILVNESNVEELSKKYDNFNGVKITIGDDIIIEKGLEDLYFKFDGGLIEMLELTPYKIMGQSTGYYLLYEQKIDGNFESKQSEFETSRDGVIIPMDTELANSLSEGDEVTLFFDENDDYNKTLDKNEYASKGKIYIMKNGKLVNILKANAKNKSDNLWAKLSEIRNNIVKSKSKKTTIKLKGGYMGFPIIKLNAEGKIIMNDIVESKVKSYGFIDESGKYVFFNEVGNYNSQYADHFKEYSKKIPVVVFEYNGKNYVFPMQINQKAQDVTADLDSILNNNSLNKFQKITEVNKLLQEHNLKTSSFILDENFINLPKIRQELSNVKQKVDITNLEEIQNIDKSIYVDMNNPFMGSKLILDLDSAKVVEVESKKNKKTPLTNKGKNLADENKC